MKIQITPRMTIADLQQTFNGLFPKLSLSFFTKPHGIYQFSPVKYLITEQNISLERLENNPHTAEVNIYAEMTTLELQELFEQEFGLHVQVLCKNGDDWTETTCTDDLSLREQNASATKTKDITLQGLQPQEYRDARTEWYLG